MTENEFAAFLGRYPRSDDKLTIKNAIILMQSALYALMPSQQDQDSDIRGATVVEWDSSAIILKDSEGQLYRVSIGEESELTIDQDARAAFNLLSVEGALDKVLNPEAVTELHRLQAEFVFEAKARAKNAERTEYERLKAKYERDDG